MKDYQLELEKILDEYAYRYEQFIVNNGSHITSMPDEHKRIRTEAVEAIEKLVEEQS